MELIVNLTTNPAFNLALEEYILTKTEREVIMLWRNARSVIIGRNQNAAEEMDMDYIREHGIVVIRRQSGGGAVFHDLGNINYTVIHKLGDADFSNYSKFTAPICGFLQNLGVDARLEGRNDLTIKGMKFSGNAQAVKNGRIMHHGTILFDADVTRLAGALKPKQAKIESKGIKSIRSRVTNLAEHLPYAMRVEEFFERLSRYFCENTQEIAEYELTADDIAGVNKLVEEKYGTWEWNFGQSPAYNFEKSAYFTFGSVDIRLSVINGIIEQASIYGDFFGVADKSGLETKLVNTRHDRESIRAAIQGTDLQQYIHGISEEEFLDLL